MENFKAWKNQDAAMCSCRHSRSSAWVRKKCTERERECVCVRARACACVCGVHQNVTRYTKPVCTKLAGKTCLMFPFDALVYIQKPCKVKY